MKPLLLVLLFVFPMAFLVIKNAIVKDRPSPPPVYQQAPPPVSSYEVGDGVSAPVAVTRVEPQYTQEALEARIEGTVELSVRVSEDGIPQVVGVLHSLDPKLDSNAAEAVGQWRFQPGMKDGVPVPVMTKVDVTFHLP